MAIYGTRKWRVGAVLLFLVFCLLVRFLRLSSHRPPHNHLHGSHVPCLTKRRKQIALPSLSLTLTKGTHFVWPISVHTEFEGCAPHFLQPRHSAQRPRYSPMCGSCKPGLPEDENRNSNEAPLLSLILVWRMGPAPVHQSEHSVLYLSFNLIGGPLCRLLLLKRIWLTYTITGGNDLAHKKRVHRGWRSLLLQLDETPNWMTEKLSAFNNPCLESSLSRPHGKHSLVSKGLYES